MLEHPLLSALREYQDRVKVTQDEYGDSYNVAMAGIAVAGETLAKKVGMYLLTLQHEEEQRKGFCPGSGRPVQSPPNEFEGYSCSVCSKELYDAGDAPDHRRLGT